jgi:NTE family protein
VQNGESSGHQDAPWRSSLAFIDALRDLPPRELANLEQRLTSLSVRRGEVLMRQGDQADALYLVVSGRFAVEVDGRATSRRSAAERQSANSLSCRRTATVTALRDSLVLKLPHAEFLELTESNPAILKPIIMTLARRLTDALAGEDQAGSPHPRTIAVINAGPWPVPEVFRRELTRALVRYGEVASIDANSVAAAFPEDPMLESDGVTLPLRSLFRRCRDRRPRAAPRIAPT